MHMYIKLKTRFYHFMFSVVFLILLILYFSLPDYKIISSSKLSFPNHTEALVNVVVYRTKGSGQLLKRITQEYMEINAPCDQLTLHLYRSKLRFASGEEPYRTVEIGAG